jgi:predicted dehydrogenase
MSAPLRIGVVGASYGARTHLPTYAKLSDVEVIAVATAHAASAQQVAERYGVQRAYEGFEALCADPDVDLVDIATRPSLHREMVCAALDGGKHVLCEAPLAQNVADGEAMMAAADSADRLAVIDMQSQFWPSMSEMSRLIRDGWLGTVDNVEARAFYPTFAQPEAVASSSWCADAESGASSLRVHGLHTADLVRWLFGELSEVRGSVTTRRSVWPGPHGPLPATSHDSAAFIARLADGGLCSVHTSWVAPHGSGWRLGVYGSRGCLVATAGGHTGHFRVHLAGARDGAEPWEHDPNESTAEVTEMAVDEPTYPFARLVRRIARRVRGSTHLQDDIPTFRDGLAMLRLAAEVEDSPATPQVAAESQPGQSV